MEDKEKTTVIIYIKGGTDKQRKKLHELAKELQAAGVTVKIKTPQPGNPEDEERFKPEGPPIE